MVPPPSRQLRSYRTDLQEVGQHDRIAKRAPKTHEPVSGVPCGCGKLLQLHFFIKSHREPCHGVSAQHVSARRKRVGQRCFSQLLENVDLDGSRDGGERQGVLSRAERVRELVAQHVEAEEGVCDDP
jgi:hypothetical protein